MKKHRGLASAVGRCKPTASTRGVPLNKCKPAGGSTILRKTKHLHFQPRHDWPLLDALAACAAARCSEFEGQAALGLAGTKWMELTDSGRASAKPLGAL